VSVLRWSTGRRGGNGETDKALPVPKPTNSTNSRRPAYAAIDLGTNNCRLLVACPDSESASGMRVIDGFSRIVRLGEGLGTSGRLSDAAIERATKALRICARKIGGRNVVETRAVATEACRQADNEDEFFSHVLDETGIRFETISPKEEAELTLAGCVPLLATEHPRVLMFDIGGGSTELMWLDNQASGGPRAIDILSLPFGVVSLAEEHGRDALSTEALEAIVERIDADLAPFENKHAIAAEIAAGRVHVLGTSGTVTTLTGVHLGLQRYDRAVVDGAFLDFDDIRVMSDRLRRQDCAARAAHPCIGPERADLVVAGCAILEAICRRWPIGRLRVADRGLREGMLLDLIRDANNESRKEKSPGR